MKLIIAACALLLSAPAALAGAACPYVDIHYVGSPWWVSNTDVLDGLESQQTWVGIRSRSQPDGKEVTRVAPHSAAAASGLLVDDILMSVNGSTDLSFDVIAPGEIAELQVMRGGATIPVSLTMRRADPVHFALANAAETFEHISGCAVRADLSAASPILRNIILKNALTEERVFRCDDAHDALAVMGEYYEINEAYLIRGSRRLLLTVPHFGTACISAAALDGDRLTDAAVLEFLMAAAADLFQYQVDNP